MSPENPEPRGELEANLTALLLGELSAEKAAALRAIISKDADLARLHDRLKIAIELIRETTTTPAEELPAEPAPLKLSDARRGKLLQHFKTVKPKEFAKPANRKRTSLLEIAALVAILAILGAMLLPALSKAKYKARRFTLMGNVSRSERGQVSTTTEEKVATLAADAALERAKPTRPAENKTVTTVASSAYQPNKPGIVYSSQSSSADYSFNPQAGATFSTRSSHDYPKLPVQQPSADSREPQLQRQSSAKGIVLPPVEQNLDQITELAAANKNELSWGTARPRAEHFSAGFGGFQSSPNDTPGKTHGDWEPNLAAFSGDSSKSPPAPPASSESAPVPALDPATGFPESISDFNAASAAQPAPNVNINAKFADVSQDNRSREIGERQFAGALEPSASNPPAPGLSAPPAPPTPEIAARGNEKLAESKPVAVAGNSTLGTFPAAQQSEVADFDIPTASPQPSASPVTRQEIASAGVHGGNSVRRKAAAVDTGVDMYFGSVSTNYIASQAGTASDDVTFKTAPAENNIALNVDGNFAWYDGAKEAPQLSDQALFEKEEMRPSEKPANVPQQHMGFSLLGPTSPSEVAPARDAESIELMGITTIPQFGNKASLAQDGVTKSGAGTLVLNGVNGFGDTTSVAAGNVINAGIAPSTNLIAASQDWSFSTSGVTNAGSLGRVARGTAWQTVQRKPAEVALDTGTLGLQDENQVTALHDFTVPDANGRNISTAGQTEEQRARVALAQTSPNGTKILNQDATFGPATNYASGSRYDTTSFYRLTNPRGVSTEKRESEAQVSEMDRKKVGEATKEVAQLRAGLKVPDSLASESQPSQLLSTESLHRIEGLRTETKAEAVRQESLLNRLKGLSQDERRQVLAKSGSDTDTDASMGKLEGDVASLNQSLKNLDAEVDRAAKEDTEKAQATKPYYDKKRELEEAKHFRRVLAMKVASEGIDQSLPKTSMVEVMDPAKPASGGRSLWDKIRGQYESAARIKIERDVPDIQGMTERVQGAGYDPYFIQTEFETIQSEKVLGKVVEAMNLNKVWGEKAKSGQALKTSESIAMLKKKLELKPVRNTSFVEIGVKSDKPEEAANLANAVALAYKEFRTEQRQELYKSGLKAMEDRLAEQEQKVRKATEELKKSNSVQKISDTNADVPPPRPPPTNAPIPQPEIQTCDNAFSTFSLNVSDVSFKLAAASLENGQMPDAVNVRSEEFINAFDYRDPEASPGVPIAFAWERARYPFAQGRDLLRFSLKTAAQGRQSGRPLNIVLLLDNSGSMERADRVQIIHEALRVLASQLKAEDKLSVITFARTPHLLEDGVPGNQAGKVADEVSGLTPQGGTNLEDAMNLAYATAMRHYLANGINRVVLLTDGAANLGNVEPEALKQKVEANRKQGVALDCFGIGWEGYNDDLLEVLSRNGDGRYGFINTPEEAGSEFAAQLAGALHVAASDVKVQVEFNPKRVTAYRQIGYAKHQLTKEQFRDNTVDAAELAAQEAGNALYVADVNAGGEGPLCTVRVRYKVPGTSDYHEHEWPVPYNGNSAALEQSSTAMRLAASASAFSEWLVSSPYAAEVTPDRLLGYLSGVPEVYGADGRPKKLEWMIRQAKSLAGK